MSDARNPKGYGFIHRDVMKAKNLSIQAKAMYALLCSYAGTKEYCHPSISLMCEDLGVSKPMVIKYLSELEEKGFIKKSRLSNDPLNNSHKYEFLPEHPMESIAPDHPEMPQSGQSDESKAELTFEARKLTTVNLAKSTVVNPESKAELTLLYKDLKVTVEKEHIQKSVCEFFGITELKNPKTFFLIALFSHHVFQTGNEKLFEQAFADYRKYKLTTNERLHNVESFLGSSEQHFEDGKWNSENWENKLKAATKGQNGQSPQTYKPKTSYERPR
jgi:hypothetical protein